MQITRQADYALRAIIFLSRLLEENEIAATGLIAEDQKIPHHF